MIDCTELEFTYDGARLALRGIDLRIDAAEFVCILGGNYMAAAKARWPST